MTTKLIGIGYRKNSGKDTAADIIIDKYGEDYATKLPFAKNLKDACRIIFGWEDVHVNGDLKEEVDGYWQMTPRHALQHVATDMFRNWIPDIWIRSAMRSIMYERDHGRHVVIPDVRFKNEIDAIKKMGGEVWLIARPSVIDLDEHRSETELDDFHEWDEVLINDGTIEQFKAKVLSAIG